jgi:electron transport complex protein RnfE
MKDSITKKAAFVSGIIKENPVFVSLLGMCPTLATTKSVESAIGMGILVILVLLGSNLLISLLRKIIPSEVKIPCYIVVIATFVTIVKMLTQAEKKWINDYHKMVYEKLAPKVNKDELEALANFTKEIK